MKSNDSQDEARRRLLVQALVSGSLGWALAAPRADAAGVLGGRPEKLPPGQSVYRITGKVLVNGQQVAADSRIAASDTIDTAPGGELIFVVGDNAMLLRENSRVTLQGGAGRLAGVQLVKGKLLSVFGGGPRQLSTPAAAINIRGTGVYLEADPEQTYFCTCYGTTDVTANHDPASKVNVVSEHHDRPLYILGKSAPGGGIRNAPFINHTDQELTLIETLVGRTPPFVFSKDSYSGPRRDY